MIKSISAKTILSGYNNADWFCSNYNMNLYRGCVHGCIYCDSRSSCYNIENFDEVLYKENAVNILQKELKSKKKKGVIMTGAMSDPYNPYERELQLTKKSLELINKYGFGVSIITKSNLITRDSQILKDISKHSIACVNITITTASDDLAKKIEPHAPSSSKRFEAVKILRNNNITTGVLMTPTLPFINDTKENIINMVKLAKRHNASYIYAYKNFCVSLRGNQRMYYYSKLDELFPGIKNKYINTFKDKYWCYSKNKEKLWEIFVNECIKNNIEYDYKKIDEIIKKGYIKTQMTLF